MIEPKFYAGDIVRVINYPALRISAKDYYKKITSVTDGPFHKPTIMGNGYYVYHIECDKDKLPWREDWLELVEPCKQINVTEKELNDIFTGD